MYVDAHCHLDILEQNLPDTKETIATIVERAKRARVGIVLTNGTDLKSNRRSLEIANKYKEVKVMMGLYPTDALGIKDSLIEEELKFIRRNKKKIAGVGEVGLDFKESESKKKHAKQREIFQKFIDLAAELKVPITVHSRKAERECIEMLEKSNAKRVIMHYFSGKLHLVDRIVGNNWFLTVPTCVKYNSHFQKLIELVPIVQLLCETDSPYSHPDKKFPNEPINITASYKKIAEIKRLNFKDVEFQIERNYRRLFRK